MRACVLYSGKFRESSLSPILYVHIRMGLKMSLQQPSNEATYESSSGDLRREMGMYVGDNKDLYGDMSMTNEYLF